MLDRTGQHSAGIRAPRSFDPDTAKRDGRTRIRLDADKSCWRSVDLGDASPRIGVVKDRGQLRSTSLGICESHFIVLARDHDVVLHPYTWAGRRSGTVLLDAGVVTAGIDKQVACRNLIDRAGAILE